jgi:hypothetical protein
MKYVDAGVHYRIRQPLEHLGREQTYEIQIGSCSLRPSFEKGIRKICHY